MEEHRENQGKRKFILNKEKVSKTIMLIKLEPIKSHLERGGNGLEDNGTF